MAISAAPDALDELVWRAQPKQRQFLQLDQVYEVLYGGAAGGGKSDALLIWCLRQAIRYPASNHLYLRRSFPELSHADGAIPRSHDLLDGTGDARWVGTEHKWLFANGSVLEFGHMLREEDKRKYQSAAYASICFDELTHFEESQYRYLFSRSRTRSPGLFTSDTRGDQPRQRRARLGQGTVHRRAAAERGQVVSGRTQQYRPAL
jgi:hypothetical protein